MRKTKPRDTTPLPNEQRWKRRTATERIAETAAARAARWPNCADCGHPRTAVIHHYDESVPGGVHHDFVAPKK